MTDIDSLITAKQFAKGPTFDYGASPQAAKANINDLIADSYSAQEAISQGAKPYAAVRDNVPYKERGPAGVGYGISYDPEPLGSIVVTTAKPGSEDKRTVQVTYDAAEAARDRVGTKRQAAAEAAAADQAARQAKVDAFMPKVTDEAIAKLREAQGSVPAAGEEAAVEDGVTDALGELLMDDEGEAAVSAEAPEAFKESDPAPPKGVSNDADHGFTGTAATQPKPAEQSAQQPAAAKPKMDPNGTRPVKAGFMQQLAGVVNQGKNLMRSEGEGDDIGYQELSLEAEFPGISKLVTQDGAEFFIDAATGKVVDGKALRRERLEERVKGLPENSLPRRIIKKSDVNARMGAWHDATQHPERASEFLKGGQPLRPFANRQDVATNRAATEAYSRDQYHLVSNEDKYDSGELAREFERLREKYGDDWYTSLNAYWNKKKAADQDDWDVYLDTTPHSERQIGGSIVPMNRIGADKPREERLLMNQNFADEVENDFTEETTTKGPTERAQIAIERMKNDQMSPESRTEEDLMAARRAARDAKFEESADITKSVLETDEADAMAEDAAAEEGPDDFEAPGIKHMKDTKRERAEAVKPVVLDDDKVRGAEVAGHDSVVSPEEGVTGMDVDVDTSSYLEALMDRGLITPEQYIRARQAFKDGRDRGLPERLENELMERLDTPIPDGLEF